VEEESLDGKRDKNRGKGWGRGGASEKRAEGRGGGGEEERGRRWRRGGEREGKGRRKVEKTGMGEGGERE